MAMGTAARVLQRTGPDCPTCGQRWPLRFGDLLIDNGRMVAYWRGQPIHLSVTEFNILTLLAEREGRATSHEAIFEAGFPHQFKTYQSDLSHLVRVNICRLRERLRTGTGGHVGITASVGIGYRLTTEEGQ